MQAKWTKRHAVAPVPQRLPTRQLSAKVDRDAAGALPGPGLLVEICVEESSDGETASSDMGPRERELRVEVVVRLEPFKRHHREIDAIDIGAQSFAALEVANRGPLQEKRKGE